MKAVFPKRPEAVLLALVGPALLLLPGGLPVGVLALGVVAAAPLALHAAGIVLVFRSNRFINFAQLQIGAVAGTLFALLVNAQPVFRGVAAVCPPCLERVTATQLTVSYWLSLAFALAVSVALSWLAYVSVIRRLDRAPRLVATVASIFLITLLAGLQRLTVDALSTTDQRTFGGVTNAVPPPVGGRFSIGSAQFGLAEVLLVLTAVGALTGTAWWLRSSATGTAIRAASQDADRAQTLGIDVGKVTGRVWMVVGGLSGAAAVLGAMVSPAGSGEAPAAGTSLVRILTVVVVARLVSLPLAGLAALALGLLITAVEFSVGSTNLLDGSLVVVVSVLLLLERRGATRTDVDASSAYLAGRQARPVPAALAELRSVQNLRRTAIALVAVLGLGAPFLLSPSQTAVLSTTLILATVGTSLLVLTGWAGLVSLGQFGFAAVGAYVAAASGLPFLLALPAGGLAGAGIAVLVGLPALRLRPLTLAISTLAFAAAVPAVLLNPDGLGRALPESLPRPRLLGVDTGDQRIFYALALLLLLLAVGAVAGLRRSRTARVLLAARDNEPAAQAFGLNLLAVRLSAFALSGFIAAVAGALFAFGQGGVKPDSFSVEQSLLIFTFTVLGGLGSLGGPLLGFAVLAALTLATANPIILNLANGLGGVLLLLLAPGGLAQLALTVRDGLLRRIAVRNGLASPSPNSRDGGDHGVAPIATNTRPGGGAVYVPRRYALSGWTPTVRAAERD